MKLETHRKLGALREARGMEFGKLVQKLLAISLLEAGVARLVERAVQGIDLEVELAGGERLALEVKTTEGGLKLGKKDVAGLEARRDEGFAPYVAVLGPRLVDEWIFARLHPGELVPGRTLSTTELRPLRDRALEDLVRETFPAAVARHVARACADGQGGLDEVLRAHPAFATA